MNNFNYHSPSTLAEAKSLLSKHEDAKLLAGVMTLFPTMKMRLATPTDLIDLGHIEALQGIAIENLSVEIGAMTTHSQVASNDQIVEELPVLATLARGIGDAQVRNRGTLGGSLSNSDPAADYPAAALGLDAVLRTDQRDILASDYFCGLFETALEETEILTAVRFIKPKRAAYVKFPNPASRYAVAGVLVAEMPDGSIRVAVTGAAPCVFRASAIEQTLEKQFSPGVVDSAGLDDSDFNDDVFASAVYRTQLVREMCKRAVTQLLDEPKG